MGMDPARALKRQDTASFSMPPLMRRTKSAPSTARRETSAVAVTSPTCTRKSTAARPRPSLGQDILCCTGVVLIITTDAIHEHGRLPCYSNKTNLLPCSPHTAARLANAQRKQLIRCMLTVSTEVIVRTMIRGRMAAG